MPIWGDKKTWNMSSLMRKNVLSAAYFNELFQLRNPSEIVSEINKHVKSFEPFIPGTNHTPSSLFCLLVKLFMMGLTEGQVRFFCDNSNPFVRIAGFLYIRFLSDPQELWERFNHYTVDPQIIPADKNLTIGMFVEKILTEQDFYGLQLPRIPTTIQSIISQKCSQLTFRRERYEKNLNKTFEKDSKIVVYLDNVENGVFKHREADKAHVQVLNKDFHVNIGDIDDEYCYNDNKAIKTSNGVLADNRKEYMKKTVSYKNSLMFTIASKRPRSPSPEENLVVEKQEIKEVYNLDAPYKKKVSDSVSAEYFKLG